MTQKYLKKFLKSVIITEINWKSSDGSGSEQKGENEDLHVWLI